MATVRHLVTRHATFRYQRRTFLTALLKPFQKSNPILESIDAVYDDDRDKTKVATDGSKSPPALYSMDGWKDAQARHAMEASTTLQSRLDASLDVFKSQRLSDGKEDLSALLDRLDQVYAPSKALQYAITLLSIAKDKEWSTFMDYVPSHELEKELIDAIESALNDVKQVEKTNEEVNAAVRYLVKCYHDANLADSSKQETLLKYQLALEEVSSELRSRSTLASKTTLGNMYQYLGLKKEIAKLHGHDTVVDQVLAHRMASREQLDILHTTVRDFVLPHVYDPKITTDAGLDNLLGMSAPPMGATSSGGLVDFNRQDERSMIRLEDHVTLDGVLTFSHRLCRDLFGVDVVEQETDEKNHVHWDDAVRLFHVYNSNSQEHIGSFYLDPFQRNGKLRRPVTVPVLPRGHTVAPVAYISLNIQPPTWDTDPAVLTWNDSEAFLHELGHVMDLMLSSNRFGSIAGPVESLPFDRSELLPKFMELWLLEKSTIYALMDASHSRVAFSDESIDAAFRVRSRRKHLELAQLAFYGSLELHIFSDFDIRGEQSLLSLQSRWAKDFTPHDMPPEKTAGPLVELFRENASGRPVAYYRYLWCEAQSAALFQELKDQHGQLSANEMQRQVRLLLLTEGDGEWRNTDALFTRYSI